MSCVLKIKQAFNGPGWTGLIGVDDWLYRTDEDTTVDEDTTDGEDSTDGDDTDAVAESMQEDDEEDEGKELWVLDIALLTWEDSWTSELYNLRSGSWLAWASGTVARYAVIDCPR